MIATKFYKALLSVLAFIASSSLYAVPANPRPFTVTQKDGTTLELKLIGDENFHYFCTTDGVPLIRLGDTYFYATLSTEGEMASTGMLAHNKPKRKANEENVISANAPLLQDYIRKTWSEKLQVRNVQRASKVKRRAFGQPTSYKGKKRGIVILVNFADLPMKPTSTVQAWHDQFNKPGYNKNNHIGSVRDYFLDQSYQQLSIDFDVVGPYTVSQGWRYYGKNRDSGNTSDQHPCQLVSEACKLANADVNFKDYDWNGNGEVDQVFVIYAGYGAAAGYDPDAIWPHEWHLDYGAYYGDGNGALRLDGVKIDTYAVSCELNGTSGTAMDPIGTAVHEFSHCLGLPDFYDVDGKGTQCMDYWDVLDAGCYSGPNWKGEVPTGYTAYERHFAGWLQYEELKDPRRVTGLENLGDTARAFIRYNQANKNEYFILENRQAKRWFKYPVGAHGLFVYHVDYDRNAWESDRPNSDPTHPRMTYIPADKSYDKSYTDRMTSDFFPGTKLVKSLTNSSHTTVFGKMFNKNSDGTYNMNLELTNISESSGKISFNYNGGDAAVKNQLKSLIASVQAMMDTPHQDMTEDATTLLDMALLEAEEVAGTTHSADEYRAATEALKSEAVKFLFAANPDDMLQPFDISFMLVNPDVTSYEGWKDEIDNNAYTLANNCGAYKDIKFNLSQTTTARLPQGQYTATVQAFQRPGAIDKAATSTINANFYAKTKSVKVKNILDDPSEQKKGTTDVMIGEGLYVPSDQKTASTYFKSGLYTNTIDFENTVSTGSSVKIGIRAAAKADYWTCFANFRLYFRGNVIDTTAPTAITSIPEDGSLQKQGIYDITGRPVTTTRSHGLYIRNGKKYAY